MSGKETIVAQDDFEFIKSEQHHKTVSEFVIFDSGRVASRATVYRRDITLSGKTYSIGELDHVATNIRYRRLGLARQNITAATAHIRDSYDLGILFCDAHMARFYTKFGWRVVDNPERVKEAGLGKVSYSRRIMVQPNLHSLSL